MPSPGEARPSPVRPRLDSTDAGTRQVVTAAFAAAARWDHAANGFHPTRCCAISTSATTRRLASGRVLREWELVAVTRRSRSRRGSIPGLDLQRRCPARRCDAGRATGCGSGSSTDPTSAHDPLPRFHPASWTGCRSPRRAAGITPGESFTYEFDADPFGLHLYHCHVSPARFAHRARPVRRLHHRPEGGPGRCRRAGDGDERLRHQLRRLQRVLRGQHGRLPLRRRAGPGASATSWSGSSW